jgi:hypothetical protein
MMMIQMTLDSRDSLALGRGVSMHGNYKSRGEIVRSPSSESEGPQGIG